MGQVRGKLQSLREQVKIQTGNPQNMELSMNKEQRTQKEKMRRRHSQSPHLSIFISCQLSRYLIEETVVGYDVIKMQGREQRGGGHQKLERFRAGKRPAEAPCEILQGPAFPWERLCGAVVCGRERSTRHLMLEGSAENLTLWPGFSESEGKANVFY